MIVCTQCGSQNESEDAFCGSCGAFLEWSGEKVETAVPAAVASTTVDTPASPAEVPAPGPSSPLGKEQPAPPEPEAGSEAGVDLRGEPEHPEDGKVAQGEEPAATGPPPEAAGAVSLPRRPEVAEPAAAKGAAGSAPGATATDPRSPGQTPSARKPGAGPAPGPVARRPDAVRPAGARPRPVSTKPPPKREIRPGDLVCGKCQEGNDPHRQFCRRCGASLVEAVEAVPPPPLPWWRRLFVRQPKVAAAGERPMRRGGSTAQRDLRSRLRQLRGATALLAVLAVGVGIAGPMRSKVTNLFRGARESVVPKLTQIAPASAEASSALKDHPATAAVDGVKNTYWAEGAKNDGAGERLTLTFNPPIHLGKIGFSLGAATKPEDFATEPRPKTVLLHFSDPAKPKDDRTKEITLQDNGDFQAYDLNAKKTGRLVIEIISVSKSPQSKTDCSIAEIEFWERK